MQPNGKRELRNLSSGLDKDSGRGSSSIPSSPAKEMSPVLGLSTSPMPTKSIETDQPNFTPELSNSCNKLLPNIEGEDLEVANELFSDPESSSPSVHPNKFEHMHKGNEQNDSTNDSSHHHKKLCPMAFTVDFGEDDEKKKTLGIADSISKFAPRHRKNLSLTKIEDIIASQRENESVESNNILDTSNREYKSLNLSLSNPTKKNDKARKTLLDSKSTMNSSSSKSKPKATVSPSSKSSFSKEKFSDVCNNNTMKNQLLPPTNPNNGDEKSETGTYTIDEPEVQEARRNLDATVDSNSEGCTNVGQENGQFEWVREWAESAAKHSLPPSEVPETQSFLQDTENLVSALQERMSRKIGKTKYNHNSENADDSGRRACHSSLEALQGFKTRQGSLSPYKVNPLHREASVLSDSGYALGYVSDSSSVEEGRRHPKNSPVKYNRAFAIRRNNAVAYDSDGNTKQEPILRAPTSSRVASPKHGINGRPPLSATSPFSRTDGGRFSLRVSKSRSPEKMAPPAPGGNFTNARPLTITPSKPVVTKTTKQEMNNTNKIRTTPPPNASPSPAFNRKPSSGSRSNSTLTAKEVELANWKRRKNYDPMKAAAGGKRKEGTPGKKDTIAVHPEAVMPPEPHYHPRTSSVHSESFQYRNSQEDIPCLMDERESSHSSSPSHHMMTRSVHEDHYSTSPVHHQQRQKNKLEALDSLVIATIHSLSVKVRTASRELLEKLQIQHRNDENGALLEEMVSQLKDLEFSSSNSSPTKSPSKELSGTLKNLKKLEQVILVLDRVLCDDDSDN